MPYVSQITPAPMAVPIPGGYGYVPTAALAQAAGPMLPRPAAGPMLPGPAAWPMLPQPAAWPYTGGLSRHRIRRGPVVILVSAGR